MSRAPILATCGWSPGRTCESNAAAGSCTNQVLPFAGVTMVIFVFALDKETVLEQVAPGLIWLATMFSLLVLVQRSFAIEADDGAMDAMRVAGVDARAIFSARRSRLARNSSSWRSCC